MICKHCGVGLEYYSTIQHSERPSCMASESGYHYFVTGIYYLFYTVYTSCWKKTKNAGRPMQCPLQARAQSSGNKR